MLDDCVDVISGFPPHFSRLIFWAIRDRSDLIIESQHQIFDCFLGLWAGGIIRIISHFIRWF